MAKVSIADSFGEATQGNVTTPNSTDAEKAKEMLETIKDNAGAWLEKGKTSLSNFFHQADEEHESKVNGGLNPYEITPDEADINTGDGPIFPIKPPFPPKPITPVVDDFDYDDRSEVMIAMKQEELLEKYQIDKDILGQFSDVVEEATREDFVGRNLEVVEVIMLYNKEMNDFKRDVQQYQTDPSTFSRMELNSQLKGTIAYYASLAEGEIQAYNEGLEQISDIEDETVLAAAKEALESRFPHAADALNNNDKVIDKGIGVVIGDKAKDAPSGQTKDPSNWRYIGRETPDIGLPNAESGDIEFNEVP